jgi:hypothetical protein
MKRYFKAEFEFGTEVRTTENFDYKYATFRAGKNAKGWEVTPKVTYHTTLELAHSGKRVIEVVPVIEIDKAEFKSIKAGA